MLYVIRDDDRFKFVLAFSAGEYARSFGFPQGFFCLCSRLSSLRRAAFAALFLRFLAICFAHDTALFFSFCFSLSLLSIASFAAPVGRPHCLFFIIGMAVAGVGSSGSSLSLLSLSVFSTT